MTDSYTMRDAVPGDEATILCFIRELATFEKRIHEVKTSEQDLTDALFGDDACAWALLVEADEEAVGFALYYKTFSTFAGKPGFHLEDLYVTPAHRGAGIGKRLLAELARRTVAIDGRRLEWTALDWNENAIAFYEGLGSQRLADWLIFRLDGDNLKQLGD